MISEPFEFVQLILLILTVAFLLLAVEYRKLSFAVIAFAVGNGFLSLAFFALGAPLVGAFNATVFSGAIAILFLITMNLDTPVNDSSNESPDNTEVEDQ